MKKASIFKKFFKKFQAYTYSTINSGFFHHFCTTASAGDFNLTLSARDSPVCFAIPAFEISEILSFPKDFFVQRIFFAYFPLKTLVKSKLGSAQRYIMRKTAYIRQHNQHNSKKIQKTQKRYKRYYEKSERRYEHSS